MASSPIASATKSLINDSPVAANKTVWHEIRAAWRLFRLGLHLLKGLAIVALIFPRIDSARRQAHKHRWSRKLLHTVGVRPGQIEKLPHGPALIVSNHISWLDIFVLNALTHTHFVCKDDVRSWPVIGWLVEHTETVFIERGSRTAAARTARTIAERLERNERVVVFPEGTTTDGTQLLPFRPALFQPAIDSEAAVLPVALRYLDRHGHPSFAPAYDGDITFWQCLRAIVLADEVQTHVEFLAPLSAKADRRNLAANAEAIIAMQLGFVAISEPYEEAA